MRTPAYHLHIYFDATSREHALRLRSHIGQTYPDVVLGRVHESPVAFHPLPMYQVTVAASDLGQLLAEICAERGSLSVLVHPLHGDPWVEHTDDAMWLGQRLELDRARLLRASSAVQRRE
ncbi:MAG: DOPA 4,5-dioxygenase family protein [Nannocystales bacterium]